MKINSTWFQLSLKRNAVRGEGNRRDKIGDIGRRSEEEEGKVVRIREWEKIFKSCQSLIQQFLFS